MKKLAFIFSLLAVCGFMLSACGDDNGNGGPTCQDPPATCDPDCTAPEICCGTTCQAIEACDPPACEAGVSYCDSCTGDCVDLPAACDPPACEPGVSYCDDGTCVDYPCGGDCDAKQEACIADVCVACDPVCTGDQFCAE